jgi:hypothetical protein
MGGRSWRRCAWALSSAKKPLDLPDRQPKEGHADQRRADKQPGHQDHQQGRPSRRAPLRAGASSRTEQASSSVPPTCACFAPKPASPTCHRRRADCLSTHNLVGSAAFASLTPCPRAAWPCVRFRLPLLGGDSAGRRSHKGLLTFAQPLVHIRCLMRGNAKINPLICQEARGSHSSPGSVAVSLTADDPPA